jgi:beta-galactosidase
MIRKCILPGILFLSFWFSSSAQNHGQRQRICLDENWKFHFGNAADPARDFNYGIANIFSKTGAASGTAIDPRFNDSSWRSLSLPHDWAVELPFVNSPSFDVMSHGYKPVGGLFPETSIGWYRKHFFVAASDSGQRFQLQFDGIFRDAQIWVNGFYVGNNKSGYVGAAYDITDYLHFNSGNVIVVRVDASQYEGWFYEGAGIYRHVWLNKYNNVHIGTDGLFVHTAVQGKAATVTIETTIENEGPATESCQLAVVLTGRDGRIEARSAPATMQIHANGKQTVIQKLVVPQAKLWTLEDPYLYRVVPSVSVNGRVVDSYSLRMGIRTIAVTKDGLFLNGKYLKVLGTNNHQDHAGVGSALPDNLQYYRVRLLKSLGVNACRTSHNAPTPEFLDACDSLGMLVLDEQRLLNSSPEYISQFKRLVLRDRSRACVFLWSIGNEEGWVQTTGNGKRIAQSLIARQKEWDPTRTCTYAADLGNVYQGINEVIPVRGFNYRQFAVVPYHKDHPNQPIVGTEMGSTVTTRGIYTKDTIRGYLPDQDITAPWWASTAEAWWSLAAVHPWWMGGFVWTGFDYRGEPTPYKWPNISSHFGILDVCGFRKNISYYYQSWWTNQDVLHISPHWNWKGKEGQPVDVWVNTNASDVELFLNEKSLGKKTMPRNGHLQWQVNYEPGVLKAVAHKEGRELTTQVETTGAPVDVVVSPSKTTMLSNGTDIAVINISVFDKQGRQVPDADNLVHLSVTGDAHIIGAGNGDPSSHEQDRFEAPAAQRHLFNGWCQFIVQAGHTPSLIHVEAGAEGLNKGATDILTIPEDSVVPVATTRQPYPIAHTVSKPVDQMLGADISFLPQLEDRGIRFKENGVEKDALEILKEHGFNYIRLRIFNDPSNDSGYAPGKGYCDLAHTLKMAKRIKEAGMKFLLDFHYSDTWADPQKQFKPRAWKQEDFTQLKRSVYEYSRTVIQALKAQGTTPDMVQVGNEINHGMIWPEGSIAHLDSLAQLIYAGINGVKSVDPAITIMLHMALGGQNEEARFFLDNMLERGIPFDVIGLSYYPKWHGTLEELQYNLNDLAAHYKKDVIVVEYSQRKQEVNNIAFGVGEGRGKGTCIWEPLNTWERLFDANGNVKKEILIYDNISRKYLHKNQDMTSRP